MLQYLLNATAIWLISLVLFDVFLRRESYHGYNRFYLLLTFLLGALLPLWQWQDDGALYNAALQRPVERVISAKETIVAAAAPSSGVINWELYLGYVYVAGVLVTVLLLIAEVVRIARLYRAGNRYRQGSCVIVETGKDYSPFSLFNLVFVSKRDRYTQEEWDTIIAHEQMHGLLLHFLDVLLMQVAKIAFWFHPLVYVYQKRLMMQHEYQADKTGKAKPQFYGKFLIEQALLQTAPSISHSFNRSPIKNRIVMLTRKSTAAARTKMLVFVPLALVCIVCFSKNSFSQKFVKNGNTVTYRGNKFELRKFHADTILTTDPVTGKEHTMIETAANQLVKMNGKPIYHHDFKGNTLKEPYFAGSNSDLWEYLMHNLKSDFAKMDDGYYCLIINNLIIDEKGKIVYYEYENVRKSNRYFIRESLIMDSSRITSIDKKDQQIIFGKINDLMQKVPPFVPGMLDGKKVIAYYDDMGFSRSIKVADHEVYETNDDRNWKELQ